MTTACLGDSLLPDDPQDLFAPRAIQVGDLITVVIQNDVRTIQSVQVQNDSSSEVTNPITSMVGTMTGITPNHQDEEERREQANTISQFQETVTATVTAVDRDKLTLTASSEVTLDKKKRHITLIGKVRKQDVTTDNRVSSQLLADAIIQVDGLHRSPVQPGIVSRVLRFLF